MLKSPMSLTFVFEKSSCFTCPGSCAYPCLGASPEVIPSAEPPILNMGLLKVLFIITFFRINHLDLLLFQELALMD